MSLFLASPRNQGRTKKKAKVANFYERKCINRCIVTVKFETIGSTVPTDTSVPQQHSLIDALPQH